MSFLSNLGASDSGGVSSYPYATSHDVPLSTRSLTFLFYTWQPGIPYSPKFPVTFDLCLYAIFHSTSRSNHTTEITENINTLQLYILLNCGHKVGHRYSTSEDESILLISSCTTAPLISEIYSHYPQLSLCPLLYAYHTKILTNSATYHLLISRCNHYWNFTGQELTFCTTI